MTKEQKEEAKRAKMEMVAALKARRDALEAKLKEKQKVHICVFFNLEQAVLGVLQGVPRLV